MLTILKLDLVFLLQISSSFGLGRVELREVALVVVEPLRVLVHDIGGDRVEERSVVGSIPRSAREMQVPDRMTHTTNRVLCHVCR